VLSHRTDRFLAIVADTKELLGGRGLVLSNGEFGGRLVDHSERFGLSFATMVMDCTSPLGTVLVDLRGLY